MKVDATPEKREFSPLSITITFESEKEMNAFYALFNHGGIMRALDIPNADHWEIRNAIKVAHGKDPNYVSFHNRLNDLIKHVPDST